LDKLLCGELTEPQAGRLAELGPEAVRLVLLAANARLAKLQTQTPAPSTPSAIIPVYQKPATPRRRKEPGARNGHEGARRKTPGRIDARVEHRVEVCPCRGGPVQRCKRTRTRIIEDIPKEITPVVTEHTIHRDYCPACKKHVEPVVPDAMPNATLGQTACKPGDNTIIEHLGQGNGTPKLSCRIKTRSFASCGWGVTQREPKTSLGTALPLWSGLMVSPKI